MASPYCYAEPIGLRPQHAFGVQAKQGSRLVLLDDMGVAPQPEGLQATLATLRVASKALLNVANVASYLGYYRSSAS